MLCLGRAYPLVAACTLGLNDVTDESPCREEDDGRSLMLPLLVSQTKQNNSRQNHHGMPAQQTNAVAHIAENRIEEREPSHGAMGIDEVRRASQNKLSP